MIGLGDIYKPTLTPIVTLLLRGRMRFIAQTATTCVRDHQHGFSPYNPIRI